MKWSRERVPGRWRASRAMAAGHGRAMAELRVRAGMAARGHWLMVHGRWPRALCAATATLGCCYGAQARPTSPWPLDDRFKGERNPIVGASGGVHKGN